jgi:hypothetical protein
MDQWNMEIGRKVGYMDESDPGSEVGGAYGCLCLRDACYATTGGPAGPFCHFLNRSGDVKGLVLVADISILKD